MKKILLPIIGSEAAFSTMFFVLTGKVVGSIISASMLLTGLLILLIVWKEIKWIQNFNGWWIIEYYSNKIFRKLWKLTVM